MTDYPSSVKAIRDNRLVSIIRMDSLQDVVAIARALHKGGIRCFEIPMTAPNAAQIIAELKKILPEDSAVGAGTVLSAEGALAVIEAGAQFIVSPHFVPELAPICRQHGAAFIPGAFTPLEIYTAWQAGAHIVKVFSIRAGGPSYISDLLGPYPKIPLMPTGGITLANAGDFLKAGACAVTLGRDLLGKAPYDAAALAAITQRAQTLVNAVNAK